MQRNWALVYAVCVCFVMGGIGAMHKCCAASTKPLLNHTSTLQQPNYSTPAFTKNEGQWNERVLFRASFERATIWLTRSGITYQFPQPITGDGKNLPEVANHSPSVTKGELTGFRDRKFDDGESPVVHAGFANAHPELTIEGEGLLDYKCNFFCGDETNQWIIDVPNYRAVIYQDVYPGVSLRLAAAHSDELTATWSARSEADLDRIAIQYEDPAGVCETDAGKLLIRVPGTDVIQSSLLSGQDPAPDRTVFTTEVSDIAQDTATVTLVYSTYLGGNLGDYGRAIAVDASGRTYVTGLTKSPDFPLQDSYDNSLDGDTDVFVAKLTPAGDALLFSTYLGGSSVEEGWDIAVDVSGNVYITGVTLSSDFPTVDAFSSNRNGMYDAFVTKIAPTGNALVYSTYLGGVSTEYGTSIALDSSQSAYITGHTKSSDFPTLSAFDDTYNGGDYDAFVTKLSAAGNALVYSTFLGGTGEPREQGFGITVDVAGCAYVTGKTGSPDFPTHNAYDDTFNGGECDAFVTKLAPTGGALHYSSFLGGSLDDEGTGIEVDINGYAYVTGNTASLGFPTQNPFDGSHNGSDDAFISKMTLSGDALVYSTFLGGTGLDYCHDIGVDPAGNAYVTGSAGSTDFPTANSYQPYQGFRDVFVSQLKADGSTLVYSTLLGGTDTEYMDEGGFGIAVDNSGNVFVTGNTHSVDFPIQNAYDDSYNGGELFYGDAFVTKIFYVPLCDCPSQSDFDEDGFITSLDLAACIDILFAGAEDIQDESCPMPRADFDCDGYSTSLDLAGLIDHLFASGPGPCEPCGL